MDSTTQALLFALLGAVLGGGVVLAWRVSEHQLRSLPEQPEPTVPADVGTVLAALRSSALVVDEDDTVLKASAPASALGLVSGRELRIVELAEMVRQVRRDGMIREAELTLSHGRSARFVTARVAPLRSRLVLVLVEDRTQQRRLEAVRRDFVANVSHELKTPVGALRLLAEAVAEASADPEAVERFAGRMRLESERLASLVQQIIELSRVQGDETLGTLAPVAVDQVVADAVDACSVDAHAAKIEVVRNQVAGLQVLGSAHQITIAVANLVANAVAYSPPGARVVVGAKPVDDAVEITVTDQGIGIPAGEIDRIFERFYRIDPARHRSTGGNGLGLSIVKHVAVAHGGDVRVWSEEGHGSSFTLTLPAAPAQQPVRRPPQPATSVAGPDLAAAAQAEESGVEHPRRQERQEANS